MATVATYAVDVARGQWPALGTKVGFISNEINFATAGSTASGEALTAFTFTDPVLVLACGIEMITPATASVTLSLGKTEDSTTFVNDQAADTTGQLAVVGPSVVPAMFADNETLIVTVGGATALAGVARVWALIADISAPH